MRTAQQYQNLQLLLQNVEYNILLSYLLQDEKFSRTKFLVVMAANPFNVENSSLQTFAECAELAATPSMR